jgi:hypothetical protein
MTQESDSIAKVRVYVLYRYDLRQGYSKLLQESFNSLTILSRLDASLWGSDFAPLNGSAVKPQESGEDSANSKIATVMSGRTGNW